MKKSQMDFFRALQEIQELTIQIMLCNEHKYDTTENLLIDTTYDAIYRIMELIDGYRKEALNLDIVDKNTSESIKEGIQLHDKCVEFLQCTDV